MLIVLYGPDSYRRQQKLKEVISDYKKKHSSFAIENFYLENPEEFNKLKDFVKTRSLFDDLKLGIVSGGSSLEKTTQKEYLELLKENLKTKDPVLILNEEKAPTKEFKFLLEKPALHQAFENLTGLHLQKFFAEESKKRNLNFDRASQNLLVQVFRNDSWGLITELDKLALLEEKHINLKVLEKHLHASLPVNVFALVNQIKNSKDIGNRLSLLEELSVRSQDSAMIFNIMAVSPYSDSGWKQKIADYDVAVKSGKLEYEEVLTDLVISE